MFLCNSGSSVSTEAEGTRAAAQPNESQQETEVTDRFILIICLHCCVFIINDVKSSKLWFSIILRHITIVKWIVNASSHWLHCLWSLPSLSLSWRIPSQLLRVPLERPKQMKVRERPAPSVLSPGPRQVTTAWPLFAVVTSSAMFVFPAGWRAEEINVHRWVSQFQWRNILLELKAWLSASLSYLKWFFFFLVL